MGFLDKVIQFIERLATGGINESVRSEKISGSTLYRKYVAGLLYCNGRKETHYALTFEDDESDREDELLRAIEDSTLRACSQIRENFGYSIEGGFRTGAPIYPEIEVGTL